jgi:archaellum component FlaG (FlaF/FlaG flagellin family)
MQPNHHAAISTDFSIKNSPTKIPTRHVQPNPHAAISTDFSVKNSSCSLTIMQLFPPTFLSKTAQQKSPPSHVQPNPHAAISTDFSVKNSPTKIPTLGHAAISTDFSIKNSSCSFSPPSVLLITRTLFSSTPKLTRAMCNIIRFFPPSGDL